MATSGKNIFNSVLKSNKNNFIEETKAEYNTNCMPKINMNSSMRAKMF